MSLSALQSKRIQSYWHSKKVWSYIHHHIWNHWCLSSVCWTEMSCTTICYHNDATENMIVHSTFHTGCSQLTSRTTVFLQAHTDNFHHAIGNSACFYAAFDITRKRCFSPAPQVCTRPGIYTSHRTTTLTRPASLPSICDVFTLTLSHFSSILIGVWFDVMTVRTPIIKTALIHHTEMGTTIHIFKQMATT
jgi:hypothetical protein